ncbi:hypothetical protein CPB84DRAFT_1790462 [Gymnopilus junonius]|uniref:Uncharacterized protein n=1 Tax=Gymnopilus junonius TaxID=109634 RepID=A0A9P5THX5_GYMJU|nr:hypothetical protein CPB84DRAFT_1790462 [Gymnopilus junonius]
MLIRLVDLIVQLGCTNNHYPVLYRLLSLPDSREQGRHMVPCGMPCQGGCVSLGIVNRFAIALR